MPEVQGVFRMATQKVRPDPGFVDRQHDHRRKQERNRKIGAFVVVAAIGVTAIALFLVTRPGGNAPTPAVAPTSVQSTDAAVLPIEDLPSVRRHVNTTDGVPFSLKVPTDGWERFGDISLNISTEGPQDAEAIIYWSVFPEGGGYLDYFGHDSARPCTRELSPLVHPSTPDLAGAVAAIPGVEKLAGGAGDTTVGGYPATYIVLRIHEDPEVRGDLGCDPGFFYSWHDVYGGAFWTTTPQGATMKVWIVDVDGTRLFIGAATTPQGSYLDREIQQIVDSIRFE